MNETEEDLRWDEWYDFRVIESEGKLYLQREYMVTGYEEDGTYNPCIDTSWNTLSILSDYGYSYKFKSYRAFDKPQDVLQFWGKAPKDKILYSSVYRNQEEAGELIDMKILYKKSDLVKMYPEYIL